MNIDKLINSGNRNKFVSFIEDCSCYELVEVWNKICVQNVQDFVYIVQQELINRNMLNVV